MRARKSRQQAVLRQKFERAHVQFAITAQRVAQSAPGFCKRWWIENDQIIRRPGFAGCAQELKTILLKPLHVQIVPRCVLPGSCNVPETFFNAGDLRRTCSRTRQGKCSLICETIQNAPPVCEPGDGWIVVSLI